MNTLPTIKMKLQNIVTIIINAVIIISLTLAAVALIATGSLICATSVTDITSYKPFDLFPRGVTLAIGLVGIAAGAAGIRIMIDFIKDRG